MNHIELIHDAETDTWTGLAKDVPGLISQADTAAEALADLYEIEQDFIQWENYQSAKTTYLAIPQETLGREFDEILHDNLWDLLVKDGDTR